MFYNKTFSKPHTALLAFSCNNTYFRQHGLLGCFSTSIAVTSIRKNMDLLERFKQITTFVFDVDGVLADGTVLLLENGLQARRMNIKDGLALQLAQRALRVVIVSGSYSPPVLARLQYLGLSEIHLGMRDKMGFLKSYLQQHNLAWQNVLYMGDDLPDLAVLKNAGLACCPADAVPEVKAVCHYISTKNGGEGCVRDVIEKVLKLSGHWQLETDLVSQ